MSTKQAKDVSFCVIPDPSIEKQDTHEIPLNGDPAPDDGWAIYVSSVIRDKDEDKCWYEGDTIAEE